jgi:hypothetical protein
MIKSFVHPGHTLKLVGSLFMRIALNDSLGHLGQLGLQCHCCPLKRNSIGGRAYAKAKKEGK